MKNNNQVALIELVEDRLHHLKLDQPYLTVLFDRDKLARKTYAILETEQANPAEHIEMKTEVAGFAIGRAINLEIYRELIESKDSLLYDWLRGHLLERLQKLNKDPITSEDLAQVVVQAIFVNLNSKINPESFLAWTHQIARRTYYRYYRKKTTNDKMVMKLDEDCDAETTDPFKAVYNKELRMALLHGITSLRPTKNTRQQQEVLLKFHFEGKSIDEIARELKVPNQRVSHLLNDVYNRLRKDDQLKQILLEWINKNAA